MLHVLFCQVLYNNYLNPNFGAINSNFSNQQFLGETISDDWASIMVSCGRSALAPSGRSIVTEMKSLKRGQQGAVNYRASRLRGGVIDSQPTARYYRRRRTTTLRYTMAVLLLFRTSAPPQICTPGHRHPHIGLLPSGHLPSGHVHPLHI